MAPLVLGTAHCCSGAPGLQSVSNAAWGIHPLLSLLQIRAEQYSC